MKVVCKNCMRFTAVTENQTCSYCNHKIVLTTMNKPLPDYVPKAFGILSLIVLFGGCVYQMGYPYNCDQAMQNLAEAQRTLRERTSPETRIDSWTAGIGKEMEARAKANQLCLK